MNRSTGACRIPHCKKKLNLYKNFQIVITCRNHRGTRYEDVQAKYCGLDFFLCCIVLHAVALQLTPRPAGLDDVILYIEDNGSFKPRGVTSMPKRKSLA